VTTKPPTPNPKTRLSEHATRAAARPAGRRGPPGDIVKLGHWGSRDTSGLQLNGDGRHEPVDADTLEIGYSHGRRSVGRSVR
jgi:hypothetical protein